jgi:flagellar biosynthesis anti-sigma factor FlgM
MEIVMSIDTIHSSTTVAANTAFNKPAPRPAEEVKAVQKPADAAYKVSFSPLAEQLLKAAPNEEEIRRDKVAAIRDQLASGTYNISGKDVAAKILNALKN